MQYNADTTGLHLHSQSHHTNIHPQILLKLKGNSNKFCKRGDMNIQKMPVFKLKLSLLVSTTFLFLWTGSEKNQIYSQVGHHIKCRSTPRLLDLGGNPAPSFCHTHTHHTCTDLHMHSLHKVSYQNKWFDSSRLLIWVGSNTTRSGRNQNCKGSTIYRQGGDPHQEVLLLRSCDWPQAWWPCQSNWPGPVNQGRSELHLSNATLPLGPSGLIIMPPATMVQDTPACHAHYKTTPSFLYFKLLQS